MSEQGETTTCIYCREPLSHRTRPAHIWPAAIGGRLKSRRICCDECNSAFSTKEGTLIEALRHTYASVGAVNDDRQPLQVTICLDSNEFLYSDGNAILQVPGTSFDPNTRTVTIPFPPGLRQQAQKTAKAMFSQGLGPDDVNRLQIVPAPPGPMLPEGPTANEHDLSVGGKLEHKQVFIKMALELLAYHRHDLAIRGELSEARRFARHGVGDFFGKPDDRSEGSGLLSIASFPEVFNGIETWTFGRSMFFRSTFLGPIVFTGLLTAEWSGERFRTAYVFDARNPSPPLVSTYVTGDGHNLSIWFGQVREEAIKKLAPALTTISERVAMERAKTKLQPEPPPDIDRLRDAVRALLAKWSQKRSRG